MPPDAPTDNDVGRVALAFAEALARRDWTSARSFLSADFLDDNDQPADLEREYDQMTAYWDKPAESVELASADSEWADVHIDSTSASYGGVLEGVAVRVEMEAGQRKITRVIWGRP
jgi:hypothetical protein